MTEGRGFESLRVLGFFSSLSYQKCVLNQVPQEGASVLIFPFKMHMLSCAA